MFFSIKNRWLLVVMAFAFPDFIHAHSFGTSGGLLVGFMHPFTGLDHFLAMFAVGLWGAQIGGRYIWTLPVTFPLIMVIGGILGILGIPLVGVEVGIALSIVVLGLAIVFSLKPAEWVVLLLVSVFAIFHGYAHGTELPKSADPADFAAGFVIATGLIHVIGIAVGLVSQKISYLTRILGGFVVIGGIYFLLKAL